MSDSLTIFSKGAQMLAEADTIQKAKELKSLALTAADWARHKQMGHAAFMHCRSYALQAERKIGQMLIESAKDRTRTTRGGNKKSKSPSVTLIQLTDIGVSKKESSKAQKLAKLSAKDFAEVVKGTKTRTAVLRKIKPKISPNGADSAPDDEPGDSAQVIWRRGVWNRAQISIGDAMFEDWSEFQVDLELIEVARQASEAWKKLATYLEELHEKETKQ